MKKVFSLWTVCLSLSSALAMETTFVASDEVSSLKLDLRLNQIHNVEWLKDLFPFACNSDVEWKTGGDPDVASQAQVTLMLAVDPADVSTWNKVGDPLVLESVTGEGLVTWTPTKQSLYLAELKVGGTVVSVGYLNLSDTKDLEGRTSIADAVVVLPSSSVPFTGNPITLSGIEVVLGTTKLIEGSDYQMSYLNNREVGDATVSIAGIGKYKDSVLRCFSIVPALPSVVTDSACAGVFCDLRKDEVLTVAYRTDLHGFTWNTSEEFHSFSSAWLIGGLPDDDAVATVSIAPIATVDSEPDESRRVVIVCAKGEGVKAWHGKAGLYQAKLTVSIGGESVGGSLTRLVRIEKDYGFVIFLN